MPSRILHSDRDAMDLLPELGREGYPVTVSWVPGEDRTKAQNRLIHKWFGEIAKQSNESADQIKRECKFYQGIPILAADDPAIVAFLSNLSHLTVEQKIASMDYISVTSSMNKTQLRAFADAVFRKYTEQGMRLTDPEALKYEEDFQ